MSKRPRGLKSSNSNSKKLKKEEEEEITIEITSENDLEALFNLFTQALEHQAENDNEQAILLLRGVVHECDKMVRIRNGSIPKATKEEIELLKKSVETCPVLPHQFYTTYANALYYLSLLDTDKPVEFLELALEKAEFAYETDKSLDTLHSLARILVHLSKNVVGKLSDFKVQMKEIQALIKTKKSEELEEALNDEKNMDAIIGTGNCWLCLADEMLLLEEETEDKLPVLEIKEILLKDSFKTGLNIKLNNNDSPVQMYLLMGECQVNLGNILDGDDPTEDDSEEAMFYYKEAVYSFEKVESLDKDALPEQFKDFLIEWKTDME